ncbi:MAG TPA: hypothetical protein VIM43_00705 [Rugosibacter sp.]
MIVKNRARHPSDQANSDSTACRPSGFANLHHDKRIDFVVAFAGWAIWKSASTLAPWFEPKLADGLVSHVLD